LKNIRAKRIPPPKSVREREEKKEKREASLTLKESLKRGGKVLAKRKGEKKQDEISLE